MRLIDANALPHYTGYALSADEVASAVENAPTIDAVPVVRCKDCKFYGTPKNFKKPYCMRGAYVKVNADDYCSKGERR